MSNKEITSSDLQVEYASGEGLTSEEIVESNEKDVNGSADMMYFTTEFDLMSLTQRIRDEEIIVPSFIKNKKISNEQTDENVLRNFQRGFVWSLRQKQNLIDTILKGYPMPGIFLVQQNDGTFLVLDGQQRLTTIAQFRESEFSVESSSIQDAGFTVDEGIGEYKYEDLDKLLRRKFNNYRIGATIIKDVLPKKSSDSSDESPKVDNIVYSIFERLNSGGTQLTPHEIRMSVYSGKLADKINDLNNDEKWRSLYKGDLQKRSRDHELISRIIAMYLKRNEYRGGQKEYLNKFYGEYRNLDLPEIQEAMERFSQAIDIVCPLGPTIFRTPGTSNVNAAWTEALIASIMATLDSYPTNKHDKLQSAVNKTWVDLIEDGVEYNIQGENKSIYDFITSNTSSKISYLGRFEICYTSLQKNLS